MRRRFSVFTQRTTIAAARTRILNKRLVFVAVNINDGTRAVRAFQPDEPKARFQFNNSGIPCRGLFCDHRVEFTGGLPRQNKSDAGNGSISSVVSS